jgi:GDP-L-fucose synthase
MKYKKVFVAGHGGMVGSSIYRSLLAAGYREADIVTRTRRELDLCDQHAVQSFFERERLGQVYLAAAKVGGIHANNHYPGDFIFENLMIQTNVIGAAFKSGVPQLLFLGSSCIYPKLAPQPMLESALLSGPLEATNEPYAVAKIAGIKLCESLTRQYGQSQGIDYRSLMPTNLYGPGDNYHAENSHVIPGLIRRFHEAKEARLPSVTVWGTGNAKREFLHVDDLASAALHIMNLPGSTFYEKVSHQCSHLNVGFDEDISIADLALEIKKVTGFAGSIEFDDSMPDGAPRKLMASSLMRSLGWQPKIGLHVGLQDAYADFINNGCRV